MENKDHSTRSTKETTSPLTFWGWLYQFMFVCHSTGRVSHTKFWSQIGYGILCFTFVWAVVIGTTASYELWFLFGIVVVGNRTLKKAFLNGKGGGSAKEPK